MMTKEYLKMTDMFELPVNDDDRKAAVDLFSHMVTTPYSVDYTVTMSKYAAHAINSHDELVAEVERLRDALECATNHLPGAAKMVAQEGWQLIPVEPTPEMSQAGVAAQAEKLKRYALGGSLPPIDHGIPDAYRAMLAAAPKSGVVE